MSYPRYKGSKNQTKSNPSPTTSTPPTVSSPQNKPATPTPASPPQPNGNASNQSATIDWLTEKIAVETRARENEAKLNKRIAELESENNKLLTENQRLQLEEAYEVVAIDNTSNNNDDVRLEELLNEIKTLKETCQQHLEDIAQLDHQNATLLQEKVVSGQHVQRLDTHVQILAENLGLKETETARLVDQFNKVAAENSQLQEENSSLEKENHRLQENLLFQPTTQREEINELKLQIEQLTDENIRLQEENEYILLNYKQLGDEVVKLREENDQLMSDSASLDGEITRLQDENAQLRSVNNNRAAEISRLQQENGQILSTKNSLVEETSKLQEDNTQILSDSNGLAAEISKLQEANAQILSDKNHLASEISKLQEENAQILSNNNSFTAEISKLQEENAQTLSIKNRFAEQTFKLQEDNAQIISENNNLVEEITKLREGNANFEKLQGENAQLLSNNAQLSDANGELIHQNKQLDSENQHLQNQVIQLEQRLKEEMDPFQQKLLTEPNILNTTKNFKNLNLHEIRPILVQFKDVNSNITAELQNDLGRLQKLLETFGSVKGAGKEINIDQVIPLWHEYLDTSFQTKTIPKNTLSAALTRHIIETIFDGMANGIQDLEMTDNQDLEFRILTATDTLTDLILHFCAAREIDQDTATALPSKIRQLVCSFVNKFGFKENEHPFVTSLAARVQQQADRYRTLKKPSGNVEKLVRLAISVFYLQMRPLGVREVTFIETSNEYNESTMDDGDDNENADEVEICWFPLILAEEPFEAQTLVTKAKVVYREPSKEVEVGKQSEGDIVYGRQWPLEIWAP